MEFTTKEIVQLVVQGGAGVLVFILFLITFRQLNSTLKEAFARHARLSESLIQLLKDEQEYKTTLTGILDRISIKLETPAQCPLLIPGRKVRVEVTE